MWKAQERGEVAKQEEIRKKKFEENVKLSSIQRRKMTRKFEDLRTALFRSVAAQKKLLQTRQDFSLHAL